MASPLDRMTATLDFQAAALSLHAERAKVLASNIANADTPNYQAKDFDFSQALALATARTGSPGNATTPARTHPAHLASPGSAEPTPALQYRQPLQSALDGNTVDLDAERAAFSENSVRYEATLRFLNSQIKTMLTAITGQ
jgi:flagellar basal-body rod protein FlgB